MSFGDSRKWMHRWFIPDLGSRPCNCDEEITKVNDNTKSAIDLYTSEMRMDSFTALRGSRRRAVSPQDWASDFYSELVAVIIEGSSSIELTVGEQSV